MSPKELMYIEDALGHIQEMKTSCTDFSNQLSDQDLKAFVSGMTNKYGECFSKFYTLLNS